jgi:hypothetical protein
MSWLILINTLPGHYKFWSAEKINRNFTGRIKFGKIGTLGNPYYYPDGYTVEKKMNEKYDKGYQLFSEDSDTSTPSNVDNPVAEIARLRRNNQV